MEATPAAPAVRETLERIISSATFARSERARSLLRHIVESDLAGKAEDLRGNAIAMDVFGRDGGFDSSTDAVVRVQAGRLRELLSQYASAEGAGDALRITIPRGTYVPAYELLAQPTEVATEDRRIIALPIGGENSPRSIEATRQSEWPLRVFWAGMTVVIVLLAMLVYRSPGGTLPASVASAARQADAAGGMAAMSSIESLPLVHVDLSGGDVAARVASLLRTGLSGFDTVDLIARDVGSRATGAAGDTIRFAFGVSDGPTDGHVTIDLLNVGTGKVLMSRVLGPDDLGPGVLEDGIADILSTTVPVSGAIYAYVDQNQLQYGLMSCLLLNDEYYLEQTPEHHGNAYRCFENLIASGAKSPLVYSELAALHLEASTDGHAYPKDATPEQALALAHKAVQMGTNSPYAHRAYGFISSRMGNSEESIRWMRKAYELNTFDLSMAAAYGYALIFCGHYADGVPIITRAVEASSARPGWWDYGLFLGEFMLGNMDAANRAAEALSTQKRPHYMAARMISAHAAGNYSAATRIASDIAVEFPKFAADPRGTFERGRYPEDLVQRLVSALRVAGLGGAG